METDNGFYISDWHIDPPTCLIQLGENSVHLEPKVMDLLVYMAQRSTQVHSRDELLEHVWPGTVVSDEALTNAIIKLRKAFKDDAHHPRFIETLSKRGYRLIADVRTTGSEVEVDSPQKTGRYPDAAATPNKSRLWRLTILSIMLLIALVAGLTLFLLDRQDSENKQTSEPVGLALPDKPSIAVLPFVNTGNEIEHSYFSDGITDDLITDLSKLSGLFVISRNSTFQYKGQSVDVVKVAQTLGVRFILEGSVRRSNNRVRVNTQLIDGLTGGQLWAERYDGDLQDVFALQDQVTAKIIAALALHLTEQDQEQLAKSETSNPDAYDEFLKGWERHWRFTRNDFAQAEVHFKKAIQLDPGYARAHAALALIYWQAWQQKWHVNSGSRLAGWVRARRELDAAMENPTPLAHSLRSAMYLYNRRYNQAIAEAERAVDLNPSSATGYLAYAEALGFNGSPEKAMEISKKALRLDPNFPAPYLFVLGRTLYDLQQYDKAIATLKRAVSVNTGDKESLVVMLAAYGQLGRLVDSGVLLEQLNSQQKAQNLPPFTLDWPKNRWPYRNKIDRDRLIEGLKKARVPEW